MKHTNIIATVAMLVVQGPAFAGGASYGEPKGGSSSNKSSSSSGAGAFSTATGGASRSSSSASGGRSTSSGGNVNVTNTNGTGGGYQGGYRNNTPDVVALGLAGGGVCTQSASAGGAGPGFGITFGGSWEAKGCERRQLAAIMSNVGRHDVAIEILCQDMDVRYAMVHAGTPCTIDRDRFAAMGVRR